MAPKNPFLLLTLANLLASLALAIFAIGFFPYKAFLPGEASFDRHDEREADVPAPFNKVIFMVVDALRSDFVYSTESGFSFVQGLIRQGAAIPFTAHASSPTITMPRIKAITTGSIPSFLDVILNFAESDTTSSLKNQDTWLSQLQRKEGGKLVMYGDDTWLKLFPDFFARQDGTTSFFVSDFTEVDNNVTRNIPFELEQSDWNGMILHYLGLDHIGHKSGSRSPNMKPKQSEMDHVVRDIYQAIDSKSHLSSTLLVLCGDHGMNDGGNHGGAAEGETSPALVFISPKMRSISNGTSCPAYKPSSGEFGYYSTIEQSDVAPTLSGLLGFPVPLNNLGVFIPRMLSFWSSENQIDLLSQNARQMATVANRTFKSSLLSEHAKLPRHCDAVAPDDTLGCLWSKAVGPGGVEEDQHGSRLANLLMFCRHAQGVLSSAASNYDSRKLYLGICVAAIAAVAAFTACLQIHILPNTIRTWAFLSILTFGTMMFASSYVEEEHNFWYWFTTAWLSWLAIKQQRQRFLNQSNFSISVVLALIGLRILRRWNQTGQKYAGSSDIARDFLPRHTFFLWTLIFLTYGEVVFRLYRHILPGRRRPLVIVLSTIVGLLSFAFKVAFTTADAPELLIDLDMPTHPWATSVSLTAQARTFFVFTSIMAVAHVAFSRPMSGNGSETQTGGVSDGLHDLLTLCLITQSRAVNIPIFLLFQIVSAAIGSTMPSQAEKAFTTLLFQYTAFFLSGGSNSISSIDLSNAYNGVSGYNVIAVGFLTFLGNWAGSIWWVSAAHLHAAAPVSREYRSQNFLNVALLTAFGSGSVLAVMLACTALRTHLFIWTVFSPKYLYILAWHFGQHICVSVGYASIHAWR